MRKPNRQMFSFKTGEFCPKKNWYRLVGCFGGPNAAQLLLSHPCTYMEPRARIYGIWNCLHGCTSHQCSKKVRKPNRQFFFLQNWRVCPQRKLATACWVLWRPQSGSNFAGHLLAPPWSLEQDPRAFGTAYMGALVISVQKK